MAQSILPLIVVPLYLAGVWLIFTVILAATVRLSSHLVAHVIYSAGCALFVTAVWGIIAFAIYALVFSQPSTGGYHGP